MGNQVVALLGVAHDYVGHDWAEVEVLVRHRDHPLARALSARLAGLTSAKALPQPVASNCCLLLRWTGGASTPGEHKLESGRRSRRRALWGRELGHGGVISVWMCESHVTCIKWVTEERTPSEQAQVGRRGRQVAVAMRDGQAETVRCYARRSAESKTSWSCDGG